MSWLKPARAIRAASRVGVCLALACSLLPFVPSTAIAADVIRVDVSTGNDFTGTGTLARPFKSITAGLAAASPGDIVRVAQGGYSEATSGEFFPIWIPRGVTVQGTGMGFGAGTVVRGNGATSVFSIDNGDSNTVLEGFIITGGGGPIGAGVHITRGQAPGFGPIVRRNFFGGNNATNFGGAIAIEKGAAAACAPAIHNNYFIGGTAGNGGAIYADSATLDLVGNLVGGGEATVGSGGGIYAIDCPDGSIQGCLFGGGIASIAGGGIAFINCGVVSVRDSMFISCQAFNGAGIYVQGTPSLTVSNGLFFDGAATNGGAAFVSSNTLFSNCTIFGNEAAGTGGGIRHAAGVCGISNSILWDNGGDDVEGAAMVSYSCTEEAAVGGVGVIHSNPRFLDSTRPNPRLRATSPCIDTGNPTTVAGEDISGIDRPQDGDGSGTARVDMGASEFWLHIGRNAGDDRYETAASMWSNDRMPFTHHAVLATGANFPDALCAASLAGVYQAPILLTEPDRLPDAVIAQLEDHEVYEVFIVGGPSVVKQSVVTELESMDIDVIRLSGDDRYETAKAVADHVVARTGSTQCLVARGDLFPDALALAPIAYDGDPVLLTRPTSIPDPTKTALDTHGYDRAVIAGSTAAVSAAVASSVEGYVGAGNVTRLGGANRYETAVEVAAHALAEEWLSADFIGLATGENFPDALAGGAVCGFEGGSLPFAFDGGPLLLTRRDGLHSATRLLMLANRADLHEIYLFGGTTVLANQVAVDCAALMP